MFIKRYQLTYLGVANVVFLSDAESGFVGGGGVQVQEAFTGRDSEDVKMSLDGVCASVCMCVCVWVCV